MITEDKAARHLSEWKSKLEEGNAWIAPVSLFAPLMLTLCTSSFRDSFGVTKDVWQAIFLICAGLSGVWSIYGLWKVTLHGGIVRLKHCLTN